METNNCFPDVFHPQNSQEMERLERLIQQFNPKITDHYESILKEYVECAYLEALNSGKSRQSVLDALEISEKEDVWVYYAWRNSLVRIPNPRVFSVVRTNRNQQKLTQQEQELLRNKTVLFVGLSVGSAAVSVFAQQGICGNYILADFDTLSLSNTNRLKASILDLGENKTTLAARMVAELDPFLQVQCVHEGITDNNLDGLLNPYQGAKPDLIVEECDNLSMKVKIRIKARQYGIPVIMESSDRGMMDIERFDLQPDLQLFHGILNDSDIKTLDSSDPEEKRALLHKIVDYDNLSSRMLLSWPEIGKSLHSWPQLAHEVTVGGATLGYCGMQVLLGNNIKSGRYYVDLNRIFETYSELGS